MQSDGMEVRREGGLLADIAEYREQWARALMAGRANALRHWGELWQA